MVTPLFVLQLGQVLVLVLGPPFGTQYMWLQTCFWAVPSQSSGVSLYDSLQLCRKSGCKGETAEPSLPNMLIFYDFFFVQRSIVSPCEKVSSSQMIFGVCLH